MFLKQFLLVLLCGTAYADYCETKEQSVICRGFDLYPEDVIEQQKIQSFKIKCNPEEPVRNLVSHQYHFNEIQSAEINDCNIEIVEASAFHGSSNLNTIALVNNNIQDIQAGAFNGLPKLKNVSLEHNKLQKIRPDMFVKLSALTELNLDNNLITEIDAESFKDLVNLQTLTINNNKLSNIEGDMFKGLGNLKILKLNGNLISTVTRANLVELTNVRSIYLEWNLIPDVDENLERISQDDDCGVILTRPFPAENQNLHYWTHCGAPPRMIE